MKLAIKYFLTPLIAIALASCYDDPGTEIVFSDVPTLEIVGSETGTIGLYTRVNDGQPEEDEFTVNLIAPKQAQPVTFTIELDPLTTAIEGVHFDFPAGKSFTIPAGSLSAAIPFVVYDDEIEPDDAFQIVVRIATGSVKISPNYNSLAHQIRVVCPSAIAGAYTSVASGSTPDFGPYTGLTRTVTLTATGTGRYGVNDISFGVYPQLYGLNAPSGTIFDICDVISGDPSNRDQFSDPFVINGTRNPISGVITLTWSNGYGDRGTVVLTRQ